MLQPLSWQSFNKGTKVIPPISSVDNSPPITGLSSAEAAEKRAAGLSNKPPRPATKSIRQIVLGNLFSPFNIVIGAIIGSLLVFSVVFASVTLLRDGMGVFLVALINTCIALFQEIKAKRALDKVNMLLIKEVTVVRDGVEHQIPHVEVVLGDVIALKRGDQAVVDGTVVRSNHMEIDESLLTGESVPIEKEKNDTILSGSFCVSGNGYYVVTSLADSSYAYGVTRIAQRPKTAVSPLQKSVNRIVTLLFFAAVMLCLLQLVESLGVRQGRLDVDLVRKLASIVIGLVPQGLVLLASVTFAIGIFRISKVGALVQTFNAVESFANVQIICMDKTGTLTQNKMTVRAITPLRDETSEAALQMTLGTYARFSSDKNATIRALEVFEADPSAEPGFEFPFSSRRKLSVLSVKRDGRENVYVLGATEILEEQCDLAARDSVGRAIRGGLDLYRNLLFGEVEDPENIDQERDSPGGFRVRPICIVSLSDTVRPDAGEVIRAFEQRNIRFKILSGDSATSILATCRDIGWAISPSDVISGSELEAIEEGVFQNAVETKIVFARLKPEQKVEIVRALQSRNLHTAMIGDGVNDVPAIKQADLGIAMDEGSAITKEVADIILLGNQFTLLPRVFEEGGKIINSVGAAAKLFLTKDVLVIYLTLLSAVLLWTFPLTPRRLSFFNFFALGAPALIIALFNTRAERRKRFLLDLLSFASISALVIVAAGYIGLAIAGSSSAALNVDNAAQMVMYSIMVVTSVVSFLIIAAGIGEAKQAVYLGYIAYSAALLLLYFLVANAGQGSKIVSWIKTFYEVRALSRAEWGIVLVVCAASGLALIGVQKLRDILVNKSTRE